MLRGHRNSSQKPSETKTFFFGGGGGVGVAKITLEASNGVPYTHLSES